METDTLRFIQLNNNSTIVHFSAGLFEDTRQGMVFTPGSLAYDGLYIRTPDYPSSRKTVSVSIVICTYDRPESLNATLKSLLNQEFKDFEIILITEKGNLAELRQLGLESARGDIVSFIDDDVYCEPTWLKSVVESFRRDKAVLGVTGPTTITEEYRANRDLFRYKLFKRLYDNIFLGGLKDIPSRLSKCGAPSTASNDHEIIYEGYCDFLEACNMSVKRKEALDVGGFDRIYYRTSEWCEVDLGLKLGRKGKLYFSNSAKLYHRPSRAGIYTARNKTRHRWENFIEFQRRWVPGSFNAYLYRSFVWVYLKMKDWRMI